MTSSTEGNVTPPHSPRGIYKYLLPYNPNLRTRARELRRAGNLSEVLLWLELKKGKLNGYDFDRQKIIGNYIVDFYCPYLGLVIEIDGISHDEKYEYDNKRDAYLRSLHLTVLHIGDSEVKNNIQGVVSLILDKINELEKV